MKNKKNFIIIATIVSLALIFTIARIAIASRDSVKAVDLATSAKKDLIQSIAVTGNIEANNKEDIMISTVQKVTDILVSEGQQVKVGDIIAKIDNTDLAYQLQKAQTNYDVTKLNLDMAKSNLNNLINVKSKSSKKTTENAVEQAQINLENIKRNQADAKTSLDQNKVLFDSGIISSQEYEASVNSASDMANQVKLAEIQLENAKSNLSDYSVDNKSQINQQRNQVEQLSKQLEGAKADVENINSKLSSNEIKASIDGKVVKLNIKENQYPTQENSIISIYDLSQYKVKVSVSQYDAIQLKQGQRAEVKIKGLDKTYEGTITSIDEAAEISFTGTNQETKIKVEVSISNADDKIKAGYEADVDIILVEAKEAIAISFEALEKDNEGKSFIYVVEKNKAVKRYIKTGMETDFDIQVIEGLKENETYIKNPPVALKERDKVKAAGGK